MRANIYTALFLVCGIALAAAQPEGSNPGLPPPAKATGLAPQTIHVAAVEEIQSANRWSSQDLLAFLINGECLEAQFDSYAALGVNIDPALSGNGPTPIGGKKANLSDEIRVYVEEVARNEAGHVRIIRESIGD